MTDIGAAVEGAIQDSATGEMSQPGSLAAIADAAYDKAVAGEAGGNGKDGTDTEDTTEAPAPTTTDDSANQDEADESGDEEGTVESDGDSEKDKETEGYYADEGQDEVKPAELETASGNPTDMGSWVLEQLPKIYVIGTSKGEQVGMEVKRAEDLPNDFEFLNKRDEMIFSQNIADQTNRAINLINQWNNDQQQSSASKFSEQENRDIQLDIASLQREGLLDRFRYQPNDDRFEKDPAVKEMQEVLDYYNEQNQRRYTESQRTGRLFSRLSYRDAFYLYQRQQAPSKQDSPEQRKADTKRKAATKVLAKGSKGQGDQSTTSRPRLAKNASVDDIIAAYGL
jgi:hypothetical protein